MFVRVVDDALVNALVASAGEDQVLFLAQLIGHLLVEHGSGRGGDD